MTVVIQFLGAAGCGKSTLAAELFSFMKKKNFNVELVTEYAKDLVWDEKEDILEFNQLLVSGMMFERLRRLNYKVDYIVTDTSILLGAIYGNNVPYLDKVLSYYYQQFDNKVFFLTRRHKDEFSVIGRRIETWEETKTTEEKILKFLKENYIEYKIIGIENRLEKVRKELEI